MTNRQQALAKLKATRDAKHGAQESSPSKSRKRKERQLKARHKTSYKPQHKRVVEGLKGLIQTQFPATSAEGDMADAREYWCQTVDDISSELFDDEYEVASIARHRWVKSPGGQVQLQFDTRYSGYEDEESWQDYRVVQGTEALAQYVLQIK